MGTLVICVMLIYFITFKLVVMYVIITKNKFDYVQMIKNPNLSYHRHCVCA